MRKPYLVIVSCLLVGMLLEGCGGKNPVNSTGALSSSTPNVQPSAASSSPSTSSNPSGQTASINPSSPSPQPSEQPLAPEKNPVGDIPDTQAFVKYSSASGGYSLEVPEGWARKEQGGNVDFTDKLGGVKVTVAEEKNTPTAASIKINQAAELEKTGRAVKIEKIEDLTLPSGKVVKVTYSSNSEPDAVTGKQIRLDNEAYYYFKNNKMAVLTLWAPLGADNVDQWKKMSESFSWAVK